MDNCLSCALKPSYNFAYFMGLSLLRLKCQHHKPLKSELYFSGYHYCIKIVLLVFMVSSIPLDINSLINSKDGYCRLYVIGEIAFNWMVVLISTIELINIKKKIIYLNMFNVILEDSRRHHIHLLLPKEKIKKFKRLSIIHVIYYWLFFGFVIFLEIYSKNLNDFWKIYKVWINSLSAFVMVPTVVQLSIEVAILQDMISVCHSVLREVLTERLIDSEKAISLEIRLGGIKSIYSKLISILRKLSEYVNPMIIVWVILDIWILIINVYILLVYWWNDTCNQSMLVLGLKTFAIILGLLYFIVSLQFLQDINDKILPYLFKYPISALCPTEAAQVEMLITTFAIQKPVIWASDVFTVGTKQLAPICGTVVTYVLVALQFNSHWINRRWYYNMHFKNETTHL